MLMICLSDTFTIFKENVSRFILISLIGPSDGGGWLKL